VPVLTSTSGGSWPDARAAASSRDLKRSLMVSVLCVGAVVVDIVYCVYCIVMVGMSVGYFIGWCSTSTSCI